MPYQVLTEAHNAQWTMGFYALGVVSWIAFLYFCRIAFPRFTKYAVSITITALACLSSVLLLEDISNSHRGMLAWILGFGGILVLLATYRFREEEVEQLIKRHGYPIMSKIVTGRERLQRYGLRFNNLTMLIRRYLPGYID